MSPRRGKESDSRVLIPIIEVPYFKRGEDHPALAGWMKPIQQFAPKARTKRNRVPRALPVGIYERGWNTCLKD